MPHPQSRPTRSCGHHAHSQAEAGEAWQNQSVQDTLQNVEQTCVDVRERQQAAFLLCPCKHVASHAAPQLHDFDNMISPPGGGRPGGKEIRLALAGCPGYVLEPSVSAWIQTRHALRTC